MTPVSNVSTAFALGNTAIIPGVHSSTFTTSSNLSRHNTAPIRRPNARRATMVAAPDFIAVSPHRSHPGAPTPLSDHAIEIVKASVPALEEHRSTIILKFYETLFERYPQFKHQFNMDRQKGGSAEASDGVPAQVSALGNMVLAYAKHIDDLSSLANAMERVAHKHVSRAVMAGQYDAIGECLLFAMQEVLDAAASPEFIEGWAEAYGFLAETFKGMEKTLGEKLSANAGYSGFIPMHVTKVKEVNGKRHMCLVPDDLPVPPHTNGQYVAVVVEDDNGEEMMSTVQIHEGGQDAMCVTVRPSKESASIYLMEHAAVGSALRVSVPCGKAKSNILA